MCWNILFARCSFSINLLVILETIITWCDFFICFITSHIFTFSHSWFAVDSYTANIYPPFTWQYYLTYSLYLSYFLIHVLLAITKSCDQDPVIPIFLLCVINNCVTGIFSQFIIHDSIQDSVILDTDVSLNITI